jgi:hypothetical protein
MSRAFSLLHHFKRTGLMFYALATVENYAKRFKH